MYIKFCKVCGQYHEHAGRYSIKCIKCVRKNKYWCNRDVTIKRKKRSYVFKRLKEIISI